jgi:cytochrome c oxidase subunit 4
MTLRKMESVGNHKVKSERVGYLVIFAALAILTLIELYVPGLKGVSQISKTLALLGLALGKAFLVAYYYMHLNHEKAWLKIIACIPMAAAVYAMVLIAESMYR